MTTPARYAKGTTVPVMKSRIELDELLTKHGATQRATFQDDEKGRAIVQFRLAERMIRLTIARDPKAKRADQAEREAWRRLLLVVKAKLEIVASGSSTVEREFLADVLLPSGETVHEKLRGQLKQSYADGKTPPLLGTGGDK